MSARGRATFYRRCNSPHVELAEYAAACVRCSPEAHMPLNSESYSHSRSGACRSVEDVKF
jgi:hypothetical protein